MKILIPTRNRLDNQRTLGNIPERIHHLITLVTYPQEREAHAEKYPTVNVVSSPEGVQGIAARREWMMKNLSEGITWMMDDDLSFQDCVDSTHFYVRYRKTKADFWDRLIGEIETTVEHGFNIGGLFSRNGPVKRHYYPAAPMRRLWNNWWINVDAVDIHTIDWVSIPFAEDFYVQAQLIERGETTLSLATVTVTPAATQAEGGCSDVRTVALHNESQRMLKEKFPNALRLKSSTAKMDGEVKISSHMAFGKLRPDWKEEMWDKYEDLREALGSPRSYNDELKRFNEEADADWKARGMDVKYAEKLAARKRENDVH